jgi:hypothetical protein
VLPVVLFLTFGLPAFDELQLTEALQLLLFAAIVHVDAEIFPEAEEGVTHDDPFQVCPPPQLLHAG